MSRTPEGVENRETLNRVARRVLLDGLEALSEQAAAVTIVGAQAVYLRSTDIELAVASFTSDADLGIYPAHLSDVPHLEQAMEAAGFALRPGQPGQWIKSQQVGPRMVDIPVDLLVPGRFANRPGRRSVNLPPHDRNSARQVDGLEAAVLDFDVMEVPSLESTDSRMLNARVAGPAALLVAKSYKIAQRAGEPGRRRLDNKDAGDIIRLMLATDEDEVAGRFNRLLGDERTAEVTRIGLVDLRRLFGAERTTGIVMAADALAGDPVGEQVSLIGPSYVSALPEPE